MLDNCAILASSDMSDGKAHNITDYPILVAGKGGGFLKYPGVHYRVASAENTSKALLTRASRGRNEPEHRRRRRRPGHRQLTAIEA